jgi:hypothetical protein
VTIVQYTFSGGLLLSAVVMTVLIGLPVKLAAHFAAAKRTGIFWCFGAVAVGMMMGCLVAALLGGYIGGPLAGFLGFVLGMRLMLGTSFAAALGLSIIAFGLSLGGFALLVKLGVIGTTAVSTSIAT